MSRIVMDEIPINCNECPFSYMGCELADYKQEEINGCMLLVKAGEEE